MAADRELARTIHTLATRLAAVERAAQLRTSTVPGADGEDVLLAPALAEAAETGAAVADLQDGLVEAGQTAAELAEEIAANRPAFDASIDQAVDALIEAAKVDTRISDEVLPAIDDAAASPITDARLTAGSLTVWPFSEQVVPAGAIAPGAVGSAEIADFALSVKKLRSDRHHLY